MRALVRRKWPLEGSKEKTYGTVRSVGVLNRTGRITAGMQLAREPQASHCVNVIPLYLTALVRDASQKWIITVHGGCGFVAGASGCWFLCCRIFFFVWLRSSQEACQVSRIERDTHASQANLTLTRIEARTSRILLGCGDKQMYTNITPSYITVSYDPDNFLPKNYSLPRPRLTCKRMQHNCMQSIEMSERCHCQHS